MFNTQGIDDTLNQFFLWAIAGLAIAAIYYGLIKRKIGLALTCAAVGVVGIVIKGLGGLVDSDLGKNIVSDHLQLLTPGPDEQTRNRRRRPPVPRPVDQRQRLRHAGRRPVLGVGHRRPLAPPTGVGAVDDQRRRVRPHRDAHLRRDRGPAAKGADYLGGEYGPVAWFGILRGELAARRRHKATRRHKPKRRVAIGPGTPLTTEASKKP